MPSRTWGAICGKRSEGAEVFGDQLAARRQHVGVGLLPAGCLEHGSGHRIDVVPPGREDLHVAPRADMGPDRLTSLEDSEGQAPGCKVCSGGQTDRSRADDGDGQPWGSS